MDAPVNRLKFYELHTLATWARMRPVKASSVRYQRRQGLHREFDAWADDPIV